MPRIESILSTNSEGPGTPLLELATLAGLGLDNPDVNQSVPGGGVIGGIGTVSGVCCMVTASDSGIGAAAGLVEGRER
jgi:geranyl-CoA carboxylase beta subunit